MGSNPASPISERSLSVNDSERFSLPDIAVAASVSAKSVCFGNTAKVTAGDCRSLGKSVVDAAVGATKFSAPAAMRCGFSFGSAVVEMCGSDSTAPGMSNSRGSV